MVGIEVIPNWAVIFGFSSVLTFTTVIFSPYCSLISSRIGETCRHGPHHGAQKSTTTGRSLWSTSASKLSSVTAFVPPIGAPPRQRGRPATGPGSGSGRRLVAVVRGSFCRICPAGPAGVVSVQQRGGGRRNGGGGL